MRQVGRDLVDRALAIHRGEPKDLAGQTIGRDRKVHCPFHQDASPSLHVYEGPQGGWYCYSCRRGTSIYDLAGPLWGLRTRGRDFHELRQRLTELLL